jgi:uncharacterized protein (UPF0335 family)
MIRIKRSNEAV